MDQRTGAIQTNLKEIALCFHTLLTTPHSTVNTTRRDLCVFYIQNINRHALLITIPKRRGVQFFNLVFFFWGGGVIAYLLMEHKFPCVNSIGRSWRTWEMNRINTHIPCVQSPREQWSRGGYPCCGRTLRWRSSLWWMDQLFLLSLFLFYFFGWTIT